MRHKPKFTKHTTVKGPKPRIRRAAPKMGNVNGKSVIMCPYCDPPHPLSTTEVSPCGAVLEVQAVQAVFRNQRCALCGKTDGEQVKVGNRFIHTHPCTPGKRMFAVTPPKSRLAALVWRFPDWAQLFIAKNFGKVVLELTTSDGHKDGYTWQAVNRA